MSLTTYTGLKTEIANWLNRNDLVNEIPDFIELAEVRLAHEVRIPTIEKKIVVSLNNEGYSSKPADFLEMKHMFFNDTPLTRVSITRMHNFTPSAGIPLYFAREVDKIRFHPTPTVGDNDRLEMIYYYKVEPLSDTVSTNVLLKTVPDLYLFGALAEAAKFIDHINDGHRWEMAYQAAYSRAMKHLRDAELAGSSPIIFSGYD